MYPTAVTVSPSHHHFSAAGSHPRFQAIFKDFGARCPPHHGFAGRQRPGQKYILILIPAAV